MARATHTRGFTLVEVLVALFIMAVIAGLGWQGIDSMLRARETAQAATERTLRLATVVAQWEQDLAAVVDTAAVPALHCDGASLRLTRRADGGVQTVVWALRQRTWQRWHSPTLLRVADLQEAWLRSQQLLGNEDGQITMVKDVDEWQVYFFQPGDNSWSNCQSTGNTAPAAAAPPPAASGASAPQVVARNRLPSGVRVALRLGEASLTRDVVLSPQGLP